MIRIALALLGALLLWSAQPAHAQTPVALNCWQGPTVPQWAPCSSSLPLSVTIVGGGGGGLSVQDQAAWTQGMSNFTPTGCAFNDTATLSSGQEGTYRCTTKRAAIVDVDTTGNALYTAITSSIVAGTNVIGYVSNDPCAQAAKTNVAISMQNTTTLKLVSLASAKQIYICSLALIASGATVFSVADGTKSSTECDTAGEAVIGAAVASHGLSLAANGGMTFGSGASTVARTTTAAHDLCLFQSGSVDLSGNITYVQQ